MEAQQQWMPLADRPTQVVSIVPKEKQPPTPDEQMEYENPLKRIRRIMFETREE